MPTPTHTTRSILHDAPPAGSDFAGGAEAMPVQPNEPGEPGEPGPIVPGSDFAGGALPLTANSSRASPTGSEPPDGIAAAAAWAPDDQTSPGSSPAAPARNRQKGPGNAESLGSSVWFILPDGHAVRVRLLEKVWAPRPFFFFFFF